MFLLCRVSLFFVLYVFVVFYRIKSLIFILENFWNYRFYSKECKVIKIKLGWVGFAS